MNKYQLMTNSGIWELIEPAVFVPTLLSNMTYLNCVMMTWPTFGACTLVLFFDWIIEIGNFTRTSMKICQKRHLFPPTELQFYDNSCDASAHNLLLWLNLKLYFDHVYIKPGPNEDESCWELVSWEFSSTLIDYPHLGPNVEQVQIRWERMRVSG